MIVGVRGFGSLAVLSHPADGRDGPCVVVLPLDAPGRDGRVVHRAAEGEVGLQVVFQGVHLLRPGEFVLELGVVQHLVQDGEPVAGGRFALRAVGPELGQNAGVVAARHYVRRVRLAGNGIERVAVGAEGAALVLAVELGIVGEIRRVIALEVAARAGADVPHHAVGGVQVAAPFHHQLEAPAVKIETVRLAGYVERRRPRIVIHRVVAPDGVLGRGVRAVLGAEGEGHHPPPLSAEERQQGVAEYLSGLVDHRTGELQRLPVVRVQDAEDGEGVVEDQRAVHGRGVGPVGVVSGLVTAVLHAEGDDLFGDVVAQVGRAAVEVVGAHVGGVVAELKHFCVEARQRSGRVRRGAVAVVEHPVGGVADRLVGGGDRVRVVLHQPVGDREFVAGLHRTHQRGRPLPVHQRPRVVHRRRGVVQVAGVHHRAGKIVADRLQHLLVPLARDRVLRE